MIPELQGGGAERVASIIGKYYVDRGEKVFYFLGKEAGKPVYEIKGKIVKTEISCGASNIFLLLCSAYIMRRYKRMYHIDVAISFMEEFNYINVLSKGKEKVIVRVCTILSQRDDLAEKFLYQKRIVHFFYNHADKVVVMTEYAKKDMKEQYGIDKKRLVKIPNPVTDGAGESPDEKWEYGDKTVICVGRLEKIKQHNVAVRAFCKVVEQVPEAKLILLGTGPNCNKIKKLISTLNLKDYVFLLGFQKNVSYFLRHSKVFLMTSKTEGFPNSMLEAMSSGLPIVSTDTPAAREILGKTVPYISHDFWWEKAVTKEENLLSETLIRMLTDEDMNKKYSELSRKRVATYSIDKVMDRWNKIIC